MLTLDALALVRFVRRRWLSLFCGAVVGLALGSAFAVLTPPEFTARAVVLLDKRANPVLAPRSAEVDGTIDTSLVDSEVEIVRSDIVLASVVERLSLEDAPGFGLPREEGSLISGWIESVRETLLGASEEAPDTAEMRTRAAIGALAEGLSVRRRGLTYVIDVTFRSPDPAEAALIANEVARAYIDGERDAERARASGTAQWLDDRLEELSERSVAAERAVEAFKAANGIVEGGAGLVDEQRLSEVNSQLVAARAATAEARARVEQIREALASPSDIASGGGGDALASDVLGRLRQDYVALTTRAANLRDRLGPSHQAVQKLNGEVAQALAAIRGELARIASVYESDFRIAQSREASLEASFDDSLNATKGVNEESAGLRNLEVEASAARALYVAMLQRRLELTQEQELTPPGARIIATAQAPRTKSAPDRKLALAGGLLLGLLLGGGFAVVRDVLDRSLRTGRHAVDDLGVSFLGHVPRVRGVGRTARAPGGEENALPSRAGPLRAVLSDPTPPFLDAMARIGMEVETARTTALGKGFVIGLVSAERDAGRTFLAANLAHMAAAGGTRTLLVDLHPRDASLSRALLADPHPDLVDVGTAGAALAEAVRHDRVSGLDMLALARRDPVAAAALARSPAIGAALRSAREGYELVVLDLPPALEGSDLRALAAHANAFVLVLRWGRTTRAAARSVLAQLPGRDRVLGTVLNRSRPDRLGRWTGDVDEEMGGIRVEPPASRAFSDADGVVVPGPGLRPVRSRAQMDA